METQVKKLTIEKKVCTRCGMGFWPQVNDKTDKVSYPGTCRNKKCNSPYWNEKITRPEVSVSSSKFQAKKKN